jgi:hypothetical protein
MLLLLEKKFLFKIFLMLKISYVKRYDVIHCRNVIKYIKSINYTL